MYRLHRFASRGAAAMSASPLRFVQTDVPGVLGIPGGNWGQGPDSSNGPWGYYVQAGQSQKRVDMPHLSQDLAERIQCLKPELSLPWGFLVRHGDEAALVDVPYFSAEIVELVKELAPGGIKHIIFTHSDFINMAEPGEWRKAFTDVTTVAHSADVTNESMDISLEGNGPWHLGDLRIDGAPGHTKGSVIISSPALSTSFGGDSMGYWEGRPTGFPRMARFSCQEQAASLRNFADNAPFFQFWFPAHGLPMHFADLGDRREQLYKAADELQAHTLPLAL